MKTELGRILNKENAIKEMRDEWELKKLSIEKKSVK